MAESPAPARIQALPSYWRGTLFRSRTEARWAVFFGVIGLEWDYEPEGFQLPGGEWYLPDFWLPEMRMWAEVKPGYGPDDKEHAKAAQLVNGTGFPLLFLHGTPRHHAFLELWPGPVGITDEYYACFSKRYTIDRADGRPRMFTLESDEATDDPWIDRAASIARRALVHEPGAGELLPTGWDDIGVVI